MPAIADMARAGDELTFDIQMNAESFIAGIDLAAVTDTDAAPEVATYEELHAMDPAALEARFRAFWPTMAENIALTADGAALAPVLVGLTVPPAPDSEVPRTSVLRFTAALPPGATAVQVGWAAPYGALVLRQNGVESPYDGYLQPGDVSPPIALGGGDQATAFEAFVDYIPVGFDHIVPKGLDHILFVLGLFFLSTSLAPLLWQVSAFTLAHTFTLAAGALGYVNIPGEIVEPIIAASIVYVAVENILSNGLSPWRPAVVFAFGLLHGLGFASVLGEFGVPANQFIPALLGFNVGVELGQLAVIAVAFLLVGYWFGKKPWYRRAIAVPASAVIAMVGGYWFVERVFL